MRLKVLGIAAIMIAAPTPALAELVCVPAPDYRGKPICESVTDTQPNQWIEFLKNNPPPPPIYYPSDPPPPQIVQFTNGLMGDDPLGIR
jgi:hypothetical protein